MNQARAQSWETIDVVALALALAGAACSGKVAELGSNAGSGPSSGPVFSGPSASQGGADAGVPPTPPSPAPRKLVDRELGIASFAIDAGQIYWIATSYPIEGFATPPEPPATRAYFRTCAVGNCAGSVKTWPLTLPMGGQASPAGLMHTNADSVFTLIDYTIFSCPKSDCSRLELVLPGMFALDFAVSGQELFTVTEDGAVLRCLVSDCPNTLTRFAMRAPAGQDAFIGANGILVDASHGYAIEYGGRVIRFPDDGTGEFETLVQGIRSVGVSFAQQGDFLYWSDPATYGYVYRCLKTGCAGQPEIVAQALHSTSALAADEATLFTSEWPVITPETVPNGVPGSARISRCALPHCDPPSPIVKDVSARALAVDDAFVYFSAQQCEDDSSADALASRCGFIATLPK